MFIFYLWKIWIYKTAIDKYFSKRENACDVVENKPSEKKQKKDNDDNNNESVCDGFHISEEDLIEAGPSSTH